MSDTTEYRSDEEIIRYYQKIAAFDFFGIWGTELMLRLPFERARAFMARGAEWDEPSWNKVKRGKDRQSVMDDVEDFFQDAVERCVDHKKTAVMSLDNFRAWAWLLRDMDLFEYLIDDRNFPNFGAPMVKAVMDKYELAELLPEDEIRRSTFLNMAQGKKCSELCIHGCGQGHPGQFTRPGLIMPGALTKIVNVPKILI